MNVKVLHGQGNHLILDGFSEAEIDNKNFIKEFLTYYSVRHYNIIYAFGTDVAF